MSKVFYSSSLRYSIYKVQNCQPQLAFKYYHMFRRLSRSFFKFFHFFKTTFLLAHKQQDALYVIVSNLSSTFFRNLQKNRASFEARCNSHYSASKISPYPPSSRLYTTANAPSASASRNAKKLWFSKFICSTASSRHMGCI